MLLVRVLEVAAAKLVYGQRQRPDRTVGAHLERRTTSQVGLQLVAAERLAIEADPLNARFLAVLGQILETPKPRGERYVFGQHDYGWVELRAHHGLHVEGSEEAILPPAQVDDPRSPVHVISGYARTLAQRGIDFVFMPIPTRVALYPEHFPGMDAPPAGFAGTGPAYRFFLQALCEAGVDVVDLWPSFAAARDADPASTDEHLFLDKDMHWTPRAVGLAADALTAHLAAQLAARGKDAQLTLPGPPQQVTLTRARETWVLKKPWFDAENPPTQDVWFERVLGPDGEPAHASERSSPVLLIGDSFAGQYQERGADLGSLFYARSGLALDVISIPAGAALRVWKTLARRGPGGLAGKRLVIYVVSAEALANPDWEQVELPGG